MTPHCKIYMKYFGYQIADDAVCELDGTRCQDVHHIHGRGKGRDIIENLMGLCRYHHTSAHNEYISKQELQEIHNKFMYENR